jgi:hypothetical protein
VSLRGRIIRLEQRAPEPRCATCRGWPDTRVVHTDPAMAAIAERYAARWQLPAGQPGPERCPGCGWEPLTVRVEYADDWGPR